MRNNSSGKKEVILKKAKQFILVKKITFPIPGVELEGTDIEIGQRQRHEEGNEKERERNREREREIERNGE